MMYAPVLILTLNRDVHFRNCIESLLRCTHVENTELFISLDYPLKDQHWEGYNKIKGYIPTISGFKNIHVIEREENLGEVRNSILSQEYVFSLYDRMIYTEDDNEFAVNFLEYINKGLDEFEFDPSIAAICSLGGLLDIPWNYPHNFMYIRGFSAWGFGTWKNRLGKQYFSSSELRQLMSDKSIVRSIKKDSLIFYYAFLQILSTGHALTGDAAVSMDLYINSRYCIYPTTSKVRNFGHDGTGLHGGNLKESPYNKLKIDTEKGFDYSVNVPKNDPTIERLVIAYGNGSFAKRAKLYFKILRLRISISKNK